MALSVIAVRAVLGTLVGQPDLGVGGSGLPAEKVMPDKPAEGRAVEGRKMRMDDQMPSRIPDPEFPHILKQEQIDRGPNPQKLRVG